MSSKTERSPLHMHHSRRANAARPRSERTLHDRTVTEQPAPFSSFKSGEKAFREVVTAISADMPLLMHGSGDVQPASVNGDSALLLSKLTANYIHELVGAAINAHDILTDGAGGLLAPPPPVAHNGKAVRPPLPYRRKYPGADEKKRKRKIGGEDYWDDPLPQPKIRAHSSHNNNKQTPEIVHVDEWVGLSGVDFYETSRSRAPHVSLPSAIGTQCFIFPICHDAQLYGRVMEVQAARRNIAPVLMDSVVMDMVAEEGKTKSKSRKRAAEKEGGDEEENEDDDVDNEDDDADKPTWPGLDQILPAYRAS